MGLFNLFRKKLEVPDHVQIGDMIPLKNQDVTVVACKKCGKMMTNIDANQIKKGDIALLKRLGVMISNPETPDPICLKCEVDHTKVEPTFKEKVIKYYQEPPKPRHDDDDDDDDSSLHTSHSYGGSSFGGSFGGGGFGGFGGGGFSGGGASRGF